jgi:hypothetical protein
MAARWPSAQSLSAPRSCFKALVGLALASAVLSAIPRVAAQHVASDDVAAHARRLSSLAAEHAETGQLEKALDLFRSSWNLVRAHRVAAQMGRLELGLKQYSEAAEHLTFALWFGPMETNDEIERERERLRHEIARALREAAHIKLEIEASTAVTSITVNGRPLNLIDSPWGAYVEPGEHRVVVKYREAAPIVRTVRLARGNIATLKFSRPEPDPESEVPRGPRTWGGGVPPPDEPEPSGRRFKSDAHIAVVATGGGLAVISAAVGAYGLVRASSTRSERDRLATELVQESGSTGQACAEPTPASRQSRCAELADLHQRLDTEQTVGMVGIAASSAFAIGTAAALVLWPDDKRSRNSQTRRPLVSATPTSSGFQWSVVGQF